jgi:hypothetical protein
LAQIQPRALGDWLFRRYRVRRGRESIGERLLCADTANRGEQYRKDSAN